MSAGKKFYAKQIDKALASAKEINQEEHPRIVVFSDCHRGNGTWNDSFLNNKTLFQAALGYYRENDFTYIELGDGDELWENRKFSDIEEIPAALFSGSADLRRQRKYKIQSDSWASGGSSE